MVKSTGVEDEGEPAADQAFGRGFGALKVRAEARRARKSRIHAEYIYGKARMVGNERILSGKEWWL